MDDFKDVSIKGRVAYLLCSLEKLLICHNAKPGDWEWILEKLWQYTASNRLDDWMLMAAELLPECVLECGPEDFEVISESEYCKLRELYSRNTDDINEMIRIVFEVGTEELFGSIPEHSPSTLAKMREAMDFFEAEGIELPDSKPFKKYKFSEHNGWGRLFDGRKLSCFLR